MLNQFFAHERRGIFRESGADVGGGTAVGVDHEVVATLSSHHADGSIEPLFDGAEQALAGIVEQRLTLPAEGQRALHGHLEIGLPLAQEGLGEALLDLQKFGKLALKSGLVVLRFAVELCAQRVEFLLCAVGFGHLPENGLAAQVAVAHCILCGGGEDGREEQEEEQEGFVVHNLMFCGVVDGEMETKYSVN